MSTASFDKEFIVTDPEAIERFLYDIEHFEPKPRPTPSREQQPDIKTALAIIKAKIAVL